MVLVPIVPVCPLLRSTNPAPFNGATQYVSSYEVRISSWLSPRSVVHRSHRRPRPELLVSLAAVLADRMLLIYCVLRGAGPQAPPHGSGERGSHISGSCFLEAPCDDHTFAPCFMIHFFITSMCFFAHLSSSHLPNRTTTNEAHFDPVPQFRVTHRLRRSLRGGAARELRLAAAARRRALAEAHGASAGGGHRCDAAHHQWQGRRDGERDGRGSLECVQPQHVV